MIFFVVVVIFIGVVASGSNLAAITQKTTAPVAPSGSPSKDDLASLFMQFLDKTSENDEKHTAAIARLSAQMAASVAKLSTEIKTLKEDALHCQSGYRTVYISEDWTYKSTQVTFASAFRLVPAVSVSTLSLVCHVSGSYHIPEFEILSPSVTKEGLSISAKVQLNMADGCTKIKIEYAYMACGKM